MFYKAPFLSFADIPLLTCCAVLPSRPPLSVRLVCGHRLKLQGRRRNTATYYSKHCLKAFCQQRAKEIRANIEGWYGSKGFASPVLRSQTALAVCQQRRCGTRASLLGLLTAISKMQYSAGPIKLYCTAQNHKYFNETWQPWYYVSKFFKSYN
jgi:hypothetical protein